MDPWPEALAGGVMGCLIALGLAFVPGLSRLVEQPSTAPFVLLVGALIGAALSWWAAARSMRKIVSAEQVVSGSSRDGERDRRAA